MYLACSAHHATSGALCTSENNGKFCAGNAETLPDTMVVDSQTSTGAPETPCREAWTDAQPRESPVYYSPASLPGASAEVGTPQVKLPDAKGAPEQAVLCTPKEAQIPAATPNEESDVGDSASVAPEPESKRDPMYWRFLDQHQYQSQQAAESLYFQMGGVHLDHFGFETLQPQ